MDIRNPYVNDSSIDSRRKLHFKHFKLYKPSLYIAPDRRRTSLWQNASGKGIKVTILLQINKLPWWLEFMSEESIVLSGRRRLPVWIERNHTLILIFCVGFVRLNYRSTKYTLLTNQNKSLLCHKSVIDFTLWFIQTEKSIALSFLPLVFFSFRYWHSGLFSWLLQLGFFVVFFFWREKKVFFFSKNLQSSHNFFFRNNQDKHHTLHK